MKFDVIIVKIELFQEIWYCIKLPNTRKIYTLGEITKIIGQLIITFFIAAVDEKY